MRIEQLRARTAEARGFKRTVCGIRLTPLRVCVLLIVVSYLSFASRWVVSVRHVEHKIDLAAEVSPPAKTTTLKLNSRAKPSDIRDAKLSRDDSAAPKIDPYASMAFYRGEKDKSKLRRLLHSFLPQPLDLEKPLPDYREPQHDEEITRLLRQAMRVVDLDRAALKHSLLLFARPGHRHRVLDLIGGQHITVSESRARIREETERFDLAPKAGLHGRDYDSLPVTISNAEHASECEVPCATCKTPSCDATSEAFTMENVPPGGTDTGPYSVSGNAELDSIVPVPYFSWHDFGVMRPITERKTALAAAFISNCGYTKRNRIVEKMLDVFGSDQLHSYGRCMHNRDEPSGASPESKIRLLMQFKFSLAFENSETKDYITEKFFGSLVSGSVPVYLGAPNVKFFAPDTGPYPYESDAVIYTGDYDHDPSVLSKLLGALDRDDESYAALLKWKEDGYSDDFKALIDFTSAHSSCRTCIRVADRRRHVIGTNEFDAKKVSRDPEGPFSFYLYLRERGMYAFHQVGFEGRPSILQLVSRTIERVPRREINIWKDNDDKRPLRKLKRVYAIYTTHGRRPVLVDEDVLALPQDAELEVIFV